MVYDSIAIGQRVLKNEIDSLQLLAQSLDDKFVAAVNALLTRRGKVVVSGIGKSGYVAHKFSATLASTGTPAFFVHPAEAAHGDMGMLCPDDILILFSNSGNTREVFLILEYALQIGVQIISITSNSTSLIAKSSDIAIILPKIDEASKISAPTTSAVMMMAVGDAISIALQEIIGFNELDYKMLHPAGEIGKKLSFVSQIMKSGDDIPIVLEEEPLSGVIIEITSKRMGCACIVNDSGFMVGVITDGDLRRNIHMNLQTTVARDIMTKTPLVLEPNTLSVVALRLLNNRRINNAFVVDEHGLPLGVIHIHDIVNHK